jgi:hypothetical protein
MLIFFPFCSLWAYFTALCHLDFTSGLSFLLLFACNELCSLDMFFSPNKFIYIFVFNYIIFPSSFPILSFNFFNLFPLLICSPCFLHSLWAIFRSTLLINDDFLWLWLYFKFLFISHNFCILHSTFCITRAIKTELSNNFPQKGLGLSTIRH